MKQTQSTCFMCDQLAPTDDHIPPKCFFPEEKDIPKGKNYRDNLITVPACKEHNLKTSKDDEYIWAIVAFHWQNTPDIQEYSVKKIHRAFERNKRLFDLFFSEQNSHKFFSYKGEKLVATTITVERIMNGFQKIARGIYYRNFEQKWVGEVIIHSRSLAVVLSTLNPNYDEKTRVAELARSLLILQPKHGKNPEVFYYQIGQDTLLSPPIFRLVFYGGFEVLAFFISPLDSFLPPSYNPANITKNADEDEYASKRFPESRVVSSENEAKAQKPNGPPSCEGKSSLIVP